jgi:hypothetical protein
MAQLQARLHSTSQIAAKQQYFPFKHKQVHDDGNNMFKISFAEVVVGKKSRRLILDEQKTAFLLQRTALLLDLTLPIWIMHNYIDKCKIKSNIFLQFTHGKQQPTFEK